MEKSIANSNSPPEIVISEHHDRPSNSSSSSWESSPASSTSRQQAQAAPQHDIEFGDFELLPPLPPRPGPRSEIGPQPQRNVRFADGQLPPPVPSRSMLRTVHDAECSGALPTSAASDTPRTNTRAETMRRDIQTMNLVRAHLPQSFYSPLPSEGEMEMRGTPTSYYAPTRVVVHGSGGQVDGAGGSNAVPVQASGIRGADDEKVVLVNREEIAGDLRSDRERRIAGDCEFVGTQQGIVEAIGDRERLGDCELITPSPSKLKLEKKRRYGCCWTKSRIVIILRIVNCLFAVVMTCAILYVLYGELALSGICIAALQFLFNFSVLITHCCKRRHPTSRIHSSSIYPRLLVLLDFLFAIALMILGMISVFYYDEDEWSGLIADQKNRACIGLGWVLGGLVQGVCLGIGALGIWG